MSTGKIETEVSKTIAEWLRELWPGWVIDNFGCADYTLDTRLTKSKFNALFWERCDAHKEPPQPD